jgi:hypothetical protein
VAQGNRANDNGPSAASYQLGELEIVRTGRASGEQPAVRPAAPPPGAPARGAKDASAARGIPHDLSFGDGDAGPALELDLETGSSLAHATAPRVAPPAAPTRPQPHAALASFGDSALDDDFDQDGFAALPALDVEATTARSATQVQKGEVAPEASVAGEREAFAALLSLADFGPAPQSLLASAPYALRVAKRLLALRGQRSQAVAQLRARHIEHDAALVAVGSALLHMAQDPRLEPLRAELTRVQEESAKLQQADQGVSHTREGNARALAVLRSEAEHLKEQLAPYFAAEASALAAQRKVEEGVRRAQAMQKRAEIELRALESATGDVDPARLEALSLQLTQRRTALEELAPGLAQASEALGKARRDLALARGGLDANEEKQRRMEAEARTREAEAEGQKQAAHGAYERVLRELAEAAKQRQLSMLVPAPAAHAANTAESVDQASEALTRLERALVLYDRAALVRGVCVLCAVLAALVAALVLT